MCSKCEEYIKTGFKFCPECGANLKNLPPVENIWTYIESLDKPDTYEEWRLAHKLLMKYGNKGANIEAKEFLEFVKAEIKKQFKK
jgi:hypothetical protein